MELPTGKRSRKSIGAGLFAVVLVFTAIVASAYFYNQNLELESKSIDLNERNLSLNSNVANLKAEISKLQTDLKKASAAIAPPAASNPSDVAKAYYATRIKGSVKLSSLKATLAAESGNFKRYAVSGSGGGASVIVKKIDDIWVGITAGQGQPSKAEGEAYSIPTGWFSTDY